MPIHSCFRKEAVEHLYYDESIKVGSDTDFVLKKWQKEKWRSSHVPEPLYIYRRHQTNLTKNRSYEELARHIQFEYSR